MPNSRQVLLVDDEADLIRGTSLWLHRAGFSTCAAHGGEEALTMASERHPDAIVLDVRMPGRDGLSVLDELRHRRDTDQIPVVMLSASLIDRQRALDAGARFFLTKPYDGTELVTAVQAAIRAPNPPEDASSAKAAHVNA